MTYADRQYPDYARRADQLILALRIRNGELSEALDRHAPDAAREITPIADHPSRYLVIGGIVSAATELALAAKDGLPFDIQLEALIDAVLANEYYWRDVASESAARTGRAEKARRTRARSR